MSNYTNISFFDRGKGKESDMHTKSTIFRASQERKVDTLAKHGHIYMK